MEWSCTTPALAGKDWENPWKWLSKTVGSQVEAGKSQILKTTSQWQPCGAVMQHWNNRLFLWALQIHRLEEIMSLWAKACAIHNYQCDLYASNHALNRFSCLLKTGDIIKPLCECRAQLRINKNRDFDVFVSAFGMLQSRETQGTRVFSKRPEV